MAAVFKQSASVNDATTGTSTAKAFASACTNGSLLIAVVYWASGSDTCSVSDPTNGTWTPIGSPLVGSADLAGFSGQAFYVNNTATTALTVTATISGSVTNRGVAIHEYTGVATLESHSESQVTTTLTPTTASETPASSSDLVFTWDVSGGSISAVSSPYTLREHSNFGGNGTADNVSPTGGSPTSATWTTSDSHNFVGIEVFSAGTTYSSSPSGTITLTGSNAATFQVSGTDSGTITLSGSNVASLTYTVAQSGTITLSGSNTINLPPQNTALPVITGTPAYDSYGTITLSCSTGTWSGSPTSYSYQWQEDDDGDGVFTNIPGATSNTFTQTDSTTPYTHLGNALRCVVTATNAAGNSSADSAATLVVYISPTIASRGNVQLIADFGSALSPELETFPDTTVYPEGEPGVLSPTSPGSSSLVPADFP